MLQCFYARACTAEIRKNKFRDTKAEELIDRIDYDFSNAEKGHSNERRNRSAECCV